MLALVIAFCIVASLTAFIVTWKFSDFFIPPRDYWTKSGFSILVVKLGMAAGAAFWTFIAITGILDSM
jgi:hypothetical protein